MEFHESGTVSLGAPKLLVSKTIPLRWAREEAQQALTLAYLSSGNKRQQSTLELGEVDLLGMIRSNRQVNVRWDLEVCQVVVQPIIVGNWQVRWKCRVWA